MAFSEDTLRRTAHLARMAVPEGELAGLTRDLEAILAMIEKLRVVPTEGTAPMAHPLELQQRLRLDEAAERSAEDRRELLKNAPQQAEGLFLVPKVIE